jgi:hypothetical protein
LIPVRAIAGQARRFVGEDDTDLAQANLRGKLLKAESTGRGRSCAAGIVINDQHIVLMPAKLTSTLLHGVLQPLALRVCYYLVRARLPHVNRRSARQMAWLNQIGSWH